jgi:hypothetical protein
LGTKDSPHPFARQNRRIQWIAAKTNGKKLNTVYRTIPSVSFNAVLDPAFWINADFDNNFQKFKITKQKFFPLKNCILYISLGLHEELSSCRRSLKLSKRTSSTFSFS